MESITKHVDASGEPEIPARSWQRITEAAEAMAASVLPGQRVALRILDDTSVRKLNREYRGVDRATDILSFPNDAGTEAHPPINQHAGDLALSWDTTLRQARANGNAPEEEAIALIAHGLLHLTGHHHDDDAADELMHARTLELLRLTGAEVTRFGH